MRKQEKMIMKLLSICIYKKHCFHIIRLEKVKFTFKCSKFEQWLMRMEYLKMHLSENICTKIVVEVAMVSKRQEKYL